MQIWIFIFIFYLYRHLVCRITLELFKNSSDSIVATYFWILFLIISYMLGKAISYKFKFIQHEPSLQPQCSDFMIFTWMQKAALCSTIVRPPIQPPVFWGVLMHCSNLWYSNDYGAVFTLQEAIEQTIGNATLADISGSSTAGTVPSTEDLSEYFPVSFCHLLSSVFQRGEKSLVVHKHHVNLVSAISCNHCQVLKIHSFHECLKTLCSNVVTHESKHLQTTKAPILMNQEHWRIQIGAHAPSDPTVQFLSFSCSFRQTSCKIIGFHLKLRSWYLRHWGLSLLILTHRVCDANFYFTTHSSHPLSFTCFQ